MRRAITDVERAAAPGGRALLDSYLIEGYRLHERALRSRAPLHTVVASSSFLGDRSRRASLLREAIESAPCDRFVAADDLVAHLTGGRGNGPLLGLVSMGEEEDPARRAVAGASLLVACDVEDPGNVGALVRTSLASGAALFIAVGISDPYHPRAVRTSMGSLFRIAVARRPSPAAAIEELKSHGFHTVGAVARGGIPLPEVELPAAVPFALFVGREAFGLAGKTASSLDTLVTIPMASNIDSYSVNAAAAIALYGLSRTGRT